MAAPAPATGAANDTAACAAPDVSLPAASPDKTAGEAETPKVTPDSGKKRRPREEKGRIDIDEKIAEAAKALKDAKKAMAQARSATKTEKRKKARLTRKASRLSVDDLERIATMKRCGLKVDAAPEQGEAPKEASADKNVSPKRAPKRTKTDVKTLPEVPQPVGASSASSAPVPTIAERIELHTEIRERSQKLQAEILEGEEGEEESEGEPDHSE